jgi:hypothetical protein
MRSRPEAQDADPGPEPAWVPVFDPDATVEFDPITEDTELPSRVDPDNGYQVIAGPDGEADGYQVIGGRWADGCVVIEIIELTEDEMEGGDAASTSLRPA